MNYLTLKKMELNEKHRKFCEEYIYDWNATRAYLKVYPDSNVTSAAVSASRLLRKPTVLKYLKELERDLSKVARVSKLMAILELRDIAFPETSNDKRNPINVNARLKALETLIKLMGWNVGIDDQVIDRPMRIFNIKIKGDGKKEKTIEETPRM